MSLKILRGAVLGAAVLSGVFSAWAVETSGIFTSNMVLQRGTKVPVWGRGKAGETVKVSFAGQSLEAKVGSKGEWQVVLSPMEASLVGRDLVVNENVYTNVLVGDVWMMAGQSNAEFSIGGVKEKAETAADTVNYPMIRATKFPWTTSPWPVTYQTCNKPWVVCDQKNVMSVTAVGYYFAKEIVKKTGIPIGILDDNWSGSTIEPFICLEGLKAKEGWTNTIRKAEENIAAAKKWIKSAAEDGNFLGERLWGQAGVLGVSWHPDNPYGAQHNAMMEPIVKFPITGILWYQGCSNENDEGYAVKLDANHGDYEKKLEALAAGWRIKWGKEKMPFYIVQLASYRAKTVTPGGGDGYAKVREKQFEAAKKIPYAGLALAIDLGDANNIHPQNKMDVGMRLARWARRDVYGEKDLVVSGPMYREMAVEGNKIRIRFDHVGSGLMVAEKAADSCGKMPVECDLEASDLKGFAIAGADKRWHWAKAEIDGQDVVVSSEEEDAPVAVRYAFRGNPMGDCNLYNKEGLPAVPFRTDRW